MDSDLAKNSKNLLQIKVVLTGATALLYLSIIRRSMIYKQGIWANPHVESWIMCKAANLNQWPVLEKRVCS